MRLFAEIPDLARRSAFAYDFSEPPRRRADITSYTRQEYWESCESKCRRYAAFKRIVYYVVDGGELGRIERMEFQRDAARFPWAPVDEPSLVYEFDEWWRWARYRHRVDEREAERIDRRGLWWDQ